MLNDLSELAARIPDGAKIAIPPSRSGVAIAATHALIARNARGLHIVAIPTSGMQADMLIGAGAVQVMESAGVTLDEQGQAGRFVAAVKAGAIRLMDSTCPALISGLQAAEKGVPFLPMRGLIGSDLLKNRPDYKVVDNPMADGPDPIVLLPAIQPDIALFHAPLADRRGNVWIGKARELMTMAHAAHTTLVTVEEITEGDLMADPLRAPATIPAMYITAIARARGGAMPLALEGVYEADSAALAAYANAARTAEGFAAWLADAPGIAAA
ncbi:MAG: CoA synthetase [Rhodobacteraceae bacterium]|nr:CoA synthetase [Paracoccaceae bacterium]